MEMGRRSLEARKRYPEAGLWGVSARFSCPWVLWAILYPYLLRLRRSDKQVVGATHGSLGMRKGRGLGWGE